MRIILTLMDVLSFLSSEGLVVLEEVIASSILV